jgi:hypothetical protein
MNIFIETGTYYGDMISAVKERFKRIYSIELNDRLYVLAKKRFANFEHMSLRHGNSQDVLSDVLTEVGEPCLFWLDAHYSGGITAKGEIETPIVKELSIISKHEIKNHVILIDDARCFNGTNHYPDLENFKRILGNLFPAHVVCVEDDVIKVFCEREQSAVPQEL